MRTINNDLSPINLSATEGRYGPDSSKFKMVGGTRRSKRKRPTRKGSGGTTPAKT